VHVSELLNLVGLGTGIVLYAMLLAMVLRAERAPGEPIRFDPLLLATAVLGLIWNLCALPAYELPKIGIAGPFTFLVALGFAALGFLPAVVVQSVLRGDHERVRGGPRRLVAFVAYAVSVTAAVLHARAAWVGDPLPSAFGMRLLTYTFIALVLPLAVVTRGQPGARRALWAAALSIFAVSAMHLSQLHRGDDSWPVELLGHHASVPLALAILYQDFPFALADLFLKRALTLLTLVAGAMLGVAAVGAIHSPEVPVRDPRDVGLLVTLWVATALLYPRIRDGIAWFVDTVVLHRPDYGTLRGRIGEGAQRVQEVGPMLDEACRQLAPALSARHVGWRVAAGSTAGSVAATGTSVAIPVTEPPQFQLDIGVLAGGRRLLSDDHAALESIAALLGRRIDAIRLADERYERERREQNIGKLATEAELRALRAQVNPHFLFNALTTIGYLIQTAPPRALETLMRLTALLRSVLRSEGEFTTLGREVSLIESYLDIEHARFEQRLRVRIEVPQALRGLRVPPLVLQPVVENAVKHGISPLLHGGSVVVSARVESVNAAASLVLTVHDSGSGVTTAQLEQGRSIGVGLKNIERRLAHQYGDLAGLTIRSEPGSGTTVEIRLPVQSNARTEPAPARTAS
jgi:two-component system, LytTR family, sensor kinase